MKQTCPITALGLCNKVVAQAFWPAVSQIFQPANVQEIYPRANKNVGDTAGRNACATTFSRRKHLKQLVSALSQSVTVPLEQ